MNNIKNYKLIDISSNDIIGSVCLAESINHDKFNNLKKISNDITKNIILSSLNHPHIIKIYGCFEFGNNKYLVVECFDYTLEQAINICRWNKYIDNFKLILMQILIAVDYLHENNIIHFNINPNNIIINSTFKKAKLLDLGSASSSLTKSSKSMTSLWYRSIEMLLDDSNSDFKSDIWSIGCVFAEMVLSIPIFIGFENITQLYEIAKILGESDDKESKKNNLFKKLKKLDNNGIDLITQMFIYDKNKRIDAKTALNHDFFK